MKSIISTQTTYIGLGSNLQNPIQQITTAIEALKQLPHSQFKACSPFYQTPPYGPVAQGDFINAVIALETRLAPFDLLNACQAIEHTQGRVRTQRWGPRTLDLDILLYGQLIIDSPELVLPHPELKQRDFVLYPLADIAPNLSLPSGESLRDLINELGQMRPDRVTMSA